MVLCGVGFGVFVVFLRGLFFGFLFCFVFSDSELEKKMTSHSRPGLKAHSRELANG